ncbi:hypothetical protein CPB83DRAFT_851952 [Crepidotus variabilis]|uniref:Uncharacterized protein n=1 Tax=Crepidotus variabilis TaxID=179855 RepID=A0A9P6JRL3_9AGAR|nr:hypothetical protein CPB83DRAFT_851952 [Crepidotus variabilis]
MAVHHSIIMHHSIVLKGLTTIINPPWVIFTASGLLFQNMRGGIFRYTYASHHVNILRVYHYLSQPELVSCALE